MQVTNERLESLRAWAERTEDAEKLAIYTELQKHRRQAQEATGGERGQGE